MASTRNKSKTPGFKSESSDYVPNKKSLMQSAPTVISTKKAKLLKTGHNKPFNSAKNNLNATPAGITNYQRKKLLLEANALAQDKLNSLNSVYDDANNSNSFMFSEQNFTRENYIKQEETYALKLKELKDRLGKLKELGILTNTQNAKLLLNKIRFGNEATYEFINEYVNELRRIEAESDESMAVVKLWYEKQKKEIEQIYQTENKRATNEFQEKRADLKENLR
jgi:hypothetical protein